MKEYIISFGEWMVDAESEEEAMSKARKRLREPDYPDIVSIEEA